MKGKDIIKKTFNRDEEKFRDYIEAINEEIAGLKKTVKKFQSKLKHEEDLKNAALEMSLDEFIAIPKH